MCRNLGSLKEVVQNIKKQKNWSAPGTDGVQNVSWKNFKAAWSAILRCFNQLIEQLDEIPNRLTRGRTMNQRLKTFAMRETIVTITCYKIFTGMIGNYMKEHAERNSIWDRSQLGTYCGVFETVDQLIIDNAIMDELRNQKRNKTIAFYNYQNAYNMIRHDWMTRVYQSMEVPEKVVTVTIKLTEGWKTRLEVTVDGKVLTSRTINITKGFLQGDSYSRVWFCLTEVLVSMLIEETDGCTMGQRDE